MVLIARALLWFQRRTNPALWAGRCPPFQSQRFHGVRPAGILKSVLSCCQFNGVQNWKVMMNLQSTSGGPHMMQHLVPAAPNRPEQAGLTSHPSTSPLVVSNRARSWATCGSGWVSWAVNLVSDPLARNQPKLARKNAKLDTFPNRPKLDTESTKEKSRKLLRLMAFGMHPAGLEPATSCMSSNLKLAAKFTFR